MMSIANKIGLGTAAIGRPKYINIRQEAAAPFELDRFRRQGIALLNAAYDQGILYFDTAPGYGLAEQLLLDWVHEKKDHSIELATKWGYSYVAAFNPDAIVHEHKEHSLSRLNDQWAQSQGLLPYLSTYQIHSATFESGVLRNRAVLHRLAELKAAHGLLMGITTTGVDQIEVLKGAMDIEMDQKQLFDVFQVTYNIFDQTLATVAGDLSGQGKRIVVKEAMANGRVFPNKRFPHYSTVYELLSHLAVKYGVGVDAVALRFCIDSIPAFRVLSGVAEERHLLDNLKANDFQLEEEDLSALRNLAIDPASYWNERKLLEWN